MANIVEDVRMFGRFARNLGRYLENPVAPDECLAMVKQGVQRREEEFLRLIRRAVYGYPGSP